MKISADTKIASIVKENPLALEAIVSISKAFEKLRNPYLFRLMAKRASIQMACKIAGCKISDFYEKLRPLGFDQDISAKISTETIIEKKEIFPDLSSLKLIQLDVRPILEKGLDPLQEILAKVNVINDKQVLEIINSFLPIPLINLLEKQGFLSEIVTQENDLSIVRFYRNAKDNKIIKIEDDYNSEDWDEVYQKYKDEWSIVDVRAMQMPQPMITILEALDTIGKHGSLFIRHHKVPLFLLPELAERNIEYRINRLDENEVNLILFHKE